MLQNLRALELNSFAPFVAADLQVLLQLTALHTLRLETRDNNFVIPKEFTRDLTRLHHLQSLALTGNPDPAFEANAFLPPNTRPLLLARLPLPSPASQAAAQPRVSV